MGVVGATPHADVHVIVVYSLLKHTNKAHISKVLIKIIALCTSIYCKRFRERNGCIHITIIIYAM